MQEEPAIDQFSSAEIAKVVKLADNGSFGELWTAVHIYYGTVAYKTLKPGPHIDSGAYKKYWDRELSAVRKLSYHPNIVPFYGYVLENNVRIGFIMEYLEGDSLHHVIHNQPPLEYTIDHCLSWAVQACRALAFCHRHHVLHRDVKPANMLVNGKRNLLKLADFGFARERGNNKTANVGTELYVAPEVWNSKPESIYDTRCDVYSMAISLWEMVRRMEPFEGRFTNTLKFQKEVISNHTRPSMINHEMTDVLALIITRNWAPLSSDPAVDRPFMEGMLLALQQLCTETRVYVGRLEI